MDKIKKSYKKTAIKAAKLAGDYLLENFTKIDRSAIRTKNPHEIVSKADLGAEKIILKTIKEKYPDHNIYSEEKGWQKTKSDYLWVIDPLDGSTNFVLHNAFFSVSIALIHNKEIVLGIVYAPFMKKLYIAEKGRGAYVNGRKIKVSKKKLIRNSFLTFCHGSKPEDIRRVIEIYRIFKSKTIDLRQFGSGALECALVASGTTDNIMIPGTHLLHLYDIAAGVLLVREAGGKVTDFKGKEWEIDSDDILASNGHIHNQLIKHLKKI